MLIKPCEQGIMLQPDHARAMAHGHRGRGARATMRVEYRNLAKHFARRVEGQQLHAVIGRSANQLDAPLLQ